MKQYVNLGSLGKVPDHKMSNAEMLQHCVDRLEWITNLVFGHRDEKGDLIKIESKQGDQVTVNYQVGLLQKFEGVWDLNPETKEPELKQAGMEQLWQSLKNMVDALAFEKQIQQGILGVMLKIKPEEMADFFNTHEMEVNAWVANYKNRMNLNFKKMDEELKKSNEDKLQSNKGEVA